MDRRQPAHQLRAGAGRRGGRRAVRRLPGRGGAHLRVEEPLRHLGRVRGHGAAGRDRARRGGAHLGARTAAHHVAATGRHRDTDLGGVRMRFAWRQLAAVVAVVVLAACGSTSSSGTGGVQTVSLKIMVGGLNKQIYLPNMLAQRLGYFAEQHLNVTLIDEGTGQASEDEVIAGNVEAGSGAYVHPLVLNTQGKKMETICQFGIAPGEAEIADSSLNISSVKDLSGKTLGVTEVGSGTWVLTQAILGTAGVEPSSAHYLGVGAGDTFIAAIQQHKIAAGMTTFPTISRLVNS